MTSNIANDAGVPLAVDKYRYLKSDRNGFPINKQVPRTYQNYSGTGGTLVYNGSNEIRIVGSTLTSPLIIQFGPPIKNMIGRLLAINVIAPISQTITLNSAPAFMVINGTALQQFTHVIPGDNNSKTISVYFHSSTFINVDYGASIGSIVPPPSSLVANVGGGAGIYRDTTGSTINLRSIVSSGLELVTTQNANTVSIADGRPIVLGIVTPPVPYALATGYSGCRVSIPNNANYSADISTAEGTITQLSFNVTGPGNMFGPNFLFQPGPRRTSPAILSCTFTKTINQIYSGYIGVVFDLSNVYDYEYVSGSNSDGSLGMYDPLIDAGAVKLMNDTFPTQVDVGVDLSRVAFNIQDNALFFTRTTSPNRIDYKSFTDSNISGLIDVNSTSAWTVGATIADLDYNEKESVLYVLPDDPFGKLMIIPIVPYSSPGPFKMGPITFVNLNLPFGSVPQSLAVSLTNGIFYYACKPAAGNITIQGHVGGNPTAIVSLTTSFSSGDVSMVVGSRDSLYVLHSDNNGLYTIDQGKSLEDGITFLYKLAAFMPSLCRNGYGFTSV
jgi:hypothetical protein